MNRENGMMCIVFAMGMEAHPFLQRVQVTERWSRGSATYRTVFFEGILMLAVKSGIGPVKAQAAVQRLELQPSVLLSVGTAGALDDDLRVGDIVLASETVAAGDPAGSLQCATDLRAALGRACEKEGRNFRNGRLVTAPKPVIRTDDRRNLRLATGAVAVDMESHALSVEARRRGVPFACLRVISDDIQADTIPSKPDVRQFWRDPLRVGSLLRTLVQFRRFMKNFRYAIHVLPPVLVRFIRDSGTKVGS